MESMKDRIEFNRTSTGKYSWSIKVYGDSKEEMFTKLDSMVKEAEDRRVKLE